MKPTAWIWGLIEPDDFERLGGPIRILQRAAFRLRMRRTTRQLIKEGNPPW